MIGAKRSSIEWISVKIGIFFSKSGLNPNQITLLSLLPAVISFYFIINQNFLLATLFFAITGFLDIVDGAVARVMGRVTIKGAYLDTIIDRYVEFLIILGLALIPLPPIYTSIQVWLIVYMFGSLMTTYAKASASEKKISEHVKGGFFERPERLIILFIGLLLASLNKIYLSYTIILLAIVSNITALQRIYKAFTR